MINYLALHLIPTTTLLQEADGGWQSVLIGLAGVAGTALLGLLAKLFGKGMDYLSKKSKLAFLANVDEIIMGFVVKLYNEEVKHLKASYADGKLTKEERKRFLKIVVEQAKDHFGVKTLGQLFGKNLDTAIESRVEKAVTVAKNAGKAAASTNP